jgi:SAM-dependent methyltransferase
MHPVNKVLYKLGVMLQKTRSTVFIPGAFHRKYLADLASVRAEPRGFRVYREERYEAGEHPESFIDFECGFASAKIEQHKPAHIFDIGSYRHFILGLLAHAQITTLDVRDRKPVHPNERVVTSDAKALSLPSSSFDMIVSLCALEHFGLGRYGDDFDLDADRLAMKEMIRVLKPGGRLVFSTTVTGGPPQIVFNAHRIYDRDMIHAMCAGLECEEEKFFVHSANGFAPPEQLSAAPEVWDVYFGCWRKPE